MHSSQDEITTESPPAPPPAEIIPATPAGNTTWRSLQRRLVVGTVVLLAGFALFLGVRKSSLSHQSVAKTSIAGADEKQSLRFKGTTEAVLTRAILAPVLAGEQARTLTIISLATAGGHVQRGDLLVEFDRQAQMRDFIDKQADYNKLAGQVVEERAKENAARAKDEAELKQAENTLSKALLEMKKIEIDSRIDAEKAQETSEEAKATVEQLRQTFDLKRKAAEAGIRIIKIQRDRTQETMLHARGNALLMQIHSPIDGIAVLTTVWKQGKMGEVQEGDQVRPGVAFMDVVDPSKMQVRVLANQEDFLSLEVGQPCRVHLDAYPDLVFPGRLEEMAPIGRSGDFSSRVRTFAVVFSITGNDRKLMPDLSAAVDVDVARFKLAAGSAR